jgi:hypothetical protein
VGDPDLETRRRPSLRELIRAGDPDAVAGFYDARAAGIREYCASVVAAELVDEATLASFIDLLGRVREANDGGDLDELLLKATRTAAAARTRVYLPASRFGRLLGRRERPAPEAVCHSTPDLLAAEANGELAAAPAALLQHIRHCTACKTTAARIHGAEWAFTREPAGEPGAGVRRRWLALAARDAGDAAG